MSDELTKKLPNDVPDTEPTILTLMERLNSMQEVMDRRHIETQELFTGVRDDINGVRDDINGVRDDINQRVQEKHELLVSRIDLLRTETDAHFRKQDHLILALNDNVLRARGDQKELFERIAVLEDKAS
jgi:BMFP domain-containing protein YqiC